MTRWFQPKLILVLALALALCLTGCVKPRPDSTPMPTKGAFLPTAVATGAVLPTSPAPTATPTLESTAEPTAEVTSTPTTQPTSVPTGDITYEVRWGDTLSRIAQQYGTTVQAIMQRNPSITNPAQLYVGTVLVIPAGSTTPPTGNTPAPGTPTPGPTAAPQTYIVQRGDTLSSIARRFGTTVAALLQANPTLTDQNRVYVGQRLNIPGGAAVAPPSAVRTHIVRAGDTISALARLYGTTVMAIVQRNNLPNANAIFVGQTLIIP